MLLNTSSTEFVESAKESSKYLREIGKYHFVLALAAAEVVAAELGVKLELSIAENTSRTFPVKSAPLFFASTCTTQSFSCSAESPLPIYTPLFATARITGWSAHRLEELINCGKIIRPAYMSISENKEYVDLKDR